MFIVIDGNDGSGKGTQVALITERLKSMGKTVKVLDYPRYDKESSFMVKKLLNGEYGTVIPPKLGSIFYAIDRYDSSFEIKEDLEKYDYIISNRYVSASMIHQGGKIKGDKETSEFLDWLYDLEYNIFGIPKPDKVIFLEVTPEVSEILIQKKEKRDYIKGGKQSDMVESDKDYIRNSWIKANQIVDMFDDWTKISCVKDGEMLPIETIIDMIMKEII